MPDDAFLTDAAESTSAAYSPDKFYTAARNKKGFGTSYRVTVPPELLARVSQLVSSKQIPEYTTPDCFFRDAVVHRIMYLDEIVDAPELTQFGHALLRKIDLERIAVHRDNLNKLLENYQRLLSGSQSIKERSDIIAMAREDLVKIEDAEYRERLANILKNWGG